MVFGDEKDLVVWGRLESGGLGWDDGLGLGN